VEDEANNPLMISRHVSKIQMLQYLDQERPYNRKKGFRYVQLKQNAWLSLLMKKSDRLLNKHEVVMYKVALDKGTLICSDHFMQSTCQVVCQQIGNQLGDAMYQTY
jgi:hypothetical protein